MACLELDSGLEDGECVRWLDVNEQYVFLTRRRSSLNGDRDMPIEGSVTRLLLHDE